MILLRFFGGTRREHISGFLSSYFSFKFSFLGEKVFVWTCASTGPVVLSVDGTWNVAK